MPPCVWFKPLSALALLSGSEAARSQDASLAGLADRSILCSVSYGLDARAEGAGRMIHEQIKQDSRAFLVGATCRF